MRSRINRAGHFVGEGTRQPPWELTDRLCQKCHGAEVRRVASELAARMCGGDHQWRGGDGLETPPEEDHRVHDPRGAGVGSPDRGHVVWLLSRTRQRLRRCQWS